MGPTIASDSNRNSFHLDPWHKLALGWIEPRVVPSGQWLRRAAGRATETPGWPCSFRPAPRHRGVRPARVSDPHHHNAGAGYDVNVPGTRPVDLARLAKPGPQPVWTAAHTTLTFPGPGKMDHSARTVKGGFHRPNQAASHCPAGRKPRAVRRPRLLHGLEQPRPIPDQPAGAGAPSARACSLAETTSRPAAPPINGRPRRQHASANYTLRFQGQQPNNGQRGWAWWPELPGAVRCRLSGQAPELRRRRRAPVGPT